MSSSTTTLRTPGILFAGPGSTWATLPPNTGLAARVANRSEEHTSELQSRVDLVCRLLLEKKKESLQQQDWVRNRSGKGRSPFAVQEQRPRRHSRLSRHQHGHPGRQRLAPKAGQSHLQPGE